MGPEETRGVQDEEIKTWGGFERNRDGASGNPDVHGQFI